MFTDRVSFIHNHQSDLIRRITDVDPLLRALRDQDLLTQEQYNDMMEKTTSEEKMRKLCDIIKYREHTQKATAYSVIREYQEEVIKDLETEDRRGRNMYWRCFRDHFVDRNRSYLINNIKEVQPVLDNLISHQLLTIEQYEDVQAMTRPKEKMRHLFCIFCHQSDTEKDQLYMSLWRYDYTVIDRLEKAEKLGKMSKAGEHVIDRYKPELIKGIKNIFPVIHDLYSKVLLTREQRDDIIIISDTEEKMRRLYDIIRDWDEFDKDEVYFSLYKHNVGMIRYLKKWKDSSTLEKTGKHVIDRYKPQLIKGIKNIFPVIHDLYSKALLTTEQRNDIMGMSDTEEKMRRLYDIIGDWDEFDKDEVYFSLYKHNDGIIRYLKSWEDSSTLEKTGEHVIDRYKPELIKRIKNIFPVIDDLYSKALLTREQRNDIRRMSDTEENMRCLYDIIGDWDEVDKDEVYFSLYKHNDGIIQYLKKWEDSSTLEKNTLSLPTISDEQRDDLSKPFTSLEIEKGIQSSPSEASMETEEPQPSLEKVTVDDFRCKLCGEFNKQDQDVTEVVSSTVGSMYQLELKSPGLYRCQKTGIKFLVKGPVMIEYKIDSWSNHSKDIPDYSYEILGPLFNIQTSGEPNAVSAVYLPHFLCLKGFSEDPSLIKCAHFRDGNMTLETPTQIEPFYITLENPTFSCLGPLLPFRKKKTPIHGSVLIYFTILCKGDPKEEHRIHLYVLPHSTNTEEALKFQLEPYQFTEIQLQEKDANISLNVCEENAKDAVWEALLTQGDINSIALLQSQLTIHAVAGAGPPPEHFVDRHREDLIQRTSNISPVLDKLLSQRLLTQEQYDTLRSMTPHQEAMRQLYVYMTIWGHSDKETLYQALKTFNEPLIRDLENSIML